MFEIIQKLAPTPPTGLYNPVAPLIITPLHLLTALVAIVRPLKVLV